MAAADYTHSPGAEELMAFLDGEGSAASRTAIEAHLADCAACQAVAAEQRQLSVETNAWSVEPAPASLRAPHPPRRRFLRMPVPAWFPSAGKVGGIAAGLAAAVAIVAVLVARQVINDGKTARRMTFTQADVFEPDGPAPDSRAAMTAPTAHPELNAQLERRDRAFTARRLPELSQAPTAADLTAEPLPRKPSIIRTAKLRIVANDFTNVQRTVQETVTTAGGFVDTLTATSEAGAVRSVRGVLRIPADRLDTVTARLRQLGQVLEDTQGSKDVTDQLVDLDARLRSARATERRLIDLLANRTAKLSDVLEVERELARVRIDIERLDAETTNVGRRVSYAALTLEIMEERKAGLTPGPLSFASRFRVAAANGVENAVESVAWTLLTIIEAGPLLLIWAVVIGSGWLILRRLWRPRTAHP